MTEGTVKVGYPEHPEMTGQAGHVDQGGRDAHEGQGGHDRHAGHRVTMFRDTFWISLALTVPTLVWGHMLPRRARLHPAERAPPAVDRPCVRDSGIPVRRLGVSTRRLAELRDRLPGMMTLIALAISVAFVFSLRVTFGLSGMPFWWELATLVTIMLLGHWIEMRGHRSAQDALSASWPSSCPSTAERVLD